MTCIVDTSTKWHLSPKLLAGIALSTLLVLGTAVASAGAAEHRDEHRGGDFRGNRGHGGWGGGYDRAPPVVYGSPYYAPSPYYLPPPVIYGPGIGIMMPGVNVNIR
jgi:hypothetical protein